MSVRKWSIYHHQIPNRTRHSITTKRSDAEPGEQLFLFTFDYPPNELRNLFNSMARIYDLEQRTENFATDCRRLIRKIPMEVANREDSKQLARASGSVAANYFKANEHLSKKDFVFRIRVCKKESKESKLWLSLLYIIDTEMDNQRKSLSREASELVKIYNSIVLKFPAESWVDFDFRVQKFRFRAFVIWSLIIGAFTV